MSFIHEHHHRRFPRNLQGSPSLDDGQDLLDLFVPSYGARHRGWSLCLQHGIAASSTLRVRALLLGLRDPASGASHLDAVGEGILIQLFLQQRHVQCAAAWAAKAARHVSSADFDFVYSDVCRDGLVCCCQGAGLLLRAFYFEGVGLPQVHRCLGQEAIPDMSHCATQVAAFSLRR